jgi:hypothetical protein
METTNALHMTKTHSNKTVLAGRIISAVCVLFLLFDSIMKVIKESHSIEGSVQLGWPEHLIQSIGILLLICTILYAIPRTAILGAILLTAYLGGATAIMVRAAQPFFFPVIFGVLVWLGLYFRDSRLCKLIPARKEEDI